MTLVRWTPWNDVVRMHNRVNRIFDGAFPPATAREEQAAGHWNPAVDIYETEEAIRIQAELPGVDKEDISIDFEDRVLTLKGERKAQTEVKRENYYRRERFIGNFHRAFNLSANFDAERITADYKDGVLTVEIPKPAEMKPRQITVH